MRTRAVTLALLAVASVVAVGAVGTPAPGDARTATPTPTPAPNASDDAAMGSQVSSFMGATSGEVSATVDDGMWDADYEDANGSDRAAAVERRTAQLRERLDELAAEKAAIQAAHENGSIDRGEYRARMSRVVGRLAALNRSIAVVSERANETGANASAVAQLRGQARELGGQEVAAVARGMAGGPPEGVPGANRSGPPGDGPPRGPPDENRTGDGSQGGPPDDNGSQSGPPDDNSSDGGGPPDERPGGGNESDCSGGNCANDALAGVLARFA
jgi:hypothetical protein